jgi:hypothetical protein
MDVVVGIAGFPIEWPRLKHFANLVSFPRKPRKIF